MKNLSKFVFVFLMLALLLAACAPAAPAAEEPMEEEPMEEPAAEEPMEEEPVEEEPAAEEPMEEEPEVVTLRIGFTASQTGSQENNSTRQVNGLNQWVEEVNAAGGIQAGNTIYMIETVSYDDESTKERVQEMYTLLATEDNVDFMISPYSSGLTEASAVIAEQFGKVMITTGAASDATYKQGLTLVFQAYTPASRYLTGALDQLKYLDPEVTRIAFIHENDSFSTDVVTAAKDYAESLGYEIVMFEGYNSETTDFNPFINKLADAEPDAILGGGHFLDGNTFTRQLYEKGLSVKYLAILVAPPDPKFAELGDAALGVVGPSQWEPLAKYTPESAAAEGLEWYGPLGTEFVDGYTSAYDSEPSYHSAGGYVAGLILQKAIEDAGSADPEAVKTALDNMDILTFYGRIKFDTSPESHGLQIGHDMVYIQWQDDGSGLAKQVVWPLAGQTAEALYPR